MPTNRSSYVILWSFQSWGYVVYIISAHTNKYTHHERLATVQTRMTSERISSTGAPTIEEQASQTLHQDDTIASRNSVR